MPTYEYECKKCGVVEVDQRISEPALTKCPQCKKNSVKRIISAPAFHLKGGGWYKDLYSSAKPSEKSASGSSGSSETSSTASDTSKTSDSSAKSESSAAPKPKQDSVEKKTKAKK